MQGKEPLGTQVVQGDLPKKLIEKKDYIYF